MSASAMAGFGVSLICMLATGAAVAPPYPRGSATMRVARAAVFGAILVSLWIPLLFALGIRPAPWNLIPLPLLAWAVHWGVVRRRRPVPPPDEATDPGVSWPLAVATGVLLLAYGLAVGWMALGSTGSDQCNCLPFLILCIFHFA